MFTFTHVTRFATGEKLDGKDVQASVSESLTVPTTMEELAALSDTTTVEIMVGLNKEGKEHRIEVPLACADYIRGRKLRSNQEQQAANKDGGKMSMRKKFADWYCSQGMTNMQDFVRKMSEAMASPAAMKAHNAWMESEYVVNKDAIEGKV